MDTYNINVRITRQRLSEQQPPQPQPQPQQPIAQAPPAAPEEITLDTSGESVIEIEPPPPPIPEVITLSPGADTVTLSDSSIASTSITSAFMSDNGQYDWSDSSPGGTRTPFLELSDERADELRAQRRENERIARMHTWNEDRRARKEEEARAEAEERCRQIQSSYRRTRKTK
jgi:transglutaminase-like putative cysteine protease